MTQGDFLDLCAYSGLQWQFAVHALSAQPKGVSGRSVYCRPCASNPPFPPAPALHESTNLAAVTLDSDNNELLQPQPQDVSRRTIRLYLQTDKHVHAQSLPKLIMPAQYHYFPTVHPRTNSQCAPPTLMKTDLPPSCPLSIAELSCIPHGM